MRGISKLLARLFDVSMIVGGALIASQIRFDDVSQRSFYLAFVAFAAAFSLAVFPAFGVYDSWRGRSKSALAGQVALSWLIVLSPFALAVVWWAWADASGYTKRKEIEKMEKRKQDRIDKNKEAIGTGGRRKR